MAKTVLVVDDYADTRFMLKFLIEMEGYQVIEAENGLEAVEIAQRETPDLVFMDLAMPVMDGFIATQKIRRLFSPEDLPVIAFSATGKSIRKEAVEAGCNELLTKPVEVSSLSALLRQYLES